MHEHPSHGKADVLAEVDILGALYIPGDNILNARPSFVGYYQPTLVLGDSIQEFL
jgi:hypothetical protein